MSEQPFRLLNRLNRELESVIDGAQRSLVKIENGQHGAGSGTVIHPDGLIITNAHVAGSRRLTVVLRSGERLRGRVLAADRRKDLAAVGVDANGLPSMEMAGRDQLYPGQWVIALGHPWGIKGAVTAGTIISVGRPVEQLPYDGELIQAGLQLRPGHSGGPMLNGSGGLVGINMMISGPEVGLGVPASTVKRFLKETLGSSPVKII